MRRSTGSISALALIAAITPVLSAGAATASPASYSPWNCTASILTDKSGSRAGCSGGPPGGEFRAVVHCSHLSPAGASEWTSLLGVSYKSRHAYCPWGEAIKAIYETR
ncbi:hypothetical protein GCM10022247_47010 [Allokutzneria multivorans]|uniref:Secreted protein n=1 Tax=Allokutzneria multivorans TaxID=1142134 RepID=A0ABP7SXX9_9PSEU